MCSVYCECAVCMVHRKPNARGPTWSKDVCVVCVRARDASANARGRRHGRGRNGRWTRARRRRLSRRHYLWESLLDFLSDSKLVGLWAQQLEQQLDHQWEFRLEQKLRYQSATK